MYLNNLHNVVIEESAGADPSAVIASELANSVVTMAVEKSEKDAKIIRQVEHYFGDVNLPRDEFLLQLIKTGDGWVTLEKLVTFPRLASITKDLSEIVSALQKSDSGLLEIDSADNKIRRSPRHPLPLLNKEDMKARTAVVGRFLFSTTFSSLLEFLYEKAAGLENIHMIFEFNAAKQKRLFTGSVELLFKTEEYCQQFIEEGPLHYKGRELVKMWFTDYKKQRELGKSEGHEKNEIKRIKGGKTKRTSGNLNGPKNYLKNSRDFEAEPLNDDVVKFNYSGKNIREAARASKEQGDPGQESCFRAMGVYRDPTNRPTRGDLFRRMASPNSEKNHPRNSDDDLEGDEALGDDVVKFNSTSKMNREDARTCTEHEDAISKRHISYP